MRSLRFKGSVTGTLSRTTAGIDRRPVEELNNYINMVTDLLDRGEVLNGTFFDSNNPDMPIKITKKTETHRVESICYMGGDVYVIIEFSDTHHGRIARSYANMMGLEPVLRMEDGKNPTFDVVLSLDNHDKLS